MTHRRGETLGGRYALKERIAIGGMGEVWAATDAVLHRVVAVKVLRTDNASVLLDRFREEARHTAALSHSGIARVHDYGEDGSDAFLVMELVPGEPLSAVLAHGGALPVATALSYLAQTAEALRAAHDIGVVHRDIKPGNLMILPDATVKVTDFGIARLVDSTSLTAVGQVVGTAQYMSPEQASGQPATSASDIYSLGVVGYEMLAGKPAFTGENPLALAMAHVHQVPRALPDSIPAGVRSLIERAMSKDPAGRPPSAASFANEARDLQRHLLPSPVASAAATVASAAVAGLPPTAISAAGPPATDVMPVGFMAGGSAPPILDRDFVRQARSKRRLVASTAVLVAALIVALVLAQATNNNSPLTATDLPASAAPQTAPVTAAPAPTSTTATTIAVTTTSVVTVLVDPDVLIGLDKAKATDRLTALGLRVVTKQAKGRGNVAKNTVVGVEPSGQLAPGSTVTLLVASKSNQGDQGNQGD
ncbi:MAG: eukaryotic-like serine/threonine-protein kinase [Ilumatobacteraceae bacterium]|jgi:serine/threonine-protein kinase